MQRSSRKLSLFAFTFDPGEYSPNAVEAYPDRFLNLIFNWGSWEWCGLVPVPGIAPNRESRGIHSGARMPCTFVRSSRRQLFCLQAYSKAAIVPGAAHSSNLRLLRTFNIFRSHAHFETSGAGDLS
jgi:hypothetical protein